MKQKDKKIYLIKLVVPETCQTWFERLAEEYHYKLNPSYDFKVHFKYSNITGYPIIGTLIDENHVKEYFTGTVITRIENIKDYCKKGKTVPRFEEIKEISINELEKKFKEIEKKLKNMERDNYKEYMFSTDYAAKKSTENPGINYFYKKFFESIKEINDIMNKKYVKIDYIEEKESEEEIESKEYIRSLKPGKKNLNK